MYFQFSGELHHWQSTSSSTLAIPSFLSGSTSNLSISSWNFKFYLHLETFCLPLHLRLPTHFTFYQTCLTADLVTKVGQRWQWVVKRLGFEPWGALIVEHLKKPRISHLIWEYSIQTTIFGVHKTGNMFSQSKPKKPSLSSSIVGMKTSQAMSTFEWTGYVQHLRTKCCRFYIATRYAVHNVSQHYFGRPKKKSFEYQARRFPVSFKYSISLSMSWSTKVHQSERLVVWIVWFIYGRLTLILLTIEWSLSVVTVDESESTQLAGHNLSTLPKWYKHMIFHENRIHIMDINTQNSWRKLWNLKIDCNLEDLCKTYTFRPSKVGITRKSTQITLYVQYVNFIQFPIGILKDFQPALLVCWRIVVMTRMIANFFAKW